MDSETVHALHTLRNAMIGLKGLKAEEQFTVYKLLFGWMKNGCVKVNTDASDWNPVDDTTFDEVLYGMGEDLIECIEHLAKVVLEYGQTSNQGGRHGKQNAVIHQ